jgi:hypothetical protein
VLALRQLLPAAPHIQQFAPTSIVFFAYAPELPEIVAEQQHILDALPPAPITSISALPVPGDIQQKQPG